MSWNSNIQFKLLVQNFLNINIYLFKQISKYNNTYKEINVSDIYIFSFNEYKNINYH